MPSLEPQSTAGISLVTLPRQSLLGLIATKVVSGPDGPFDRSYFDHSFDHSFDPPRVVRSVLTGLVAEHRAGRQRRVEPPRHVVVPHRIRRTQPAPVHRRRAVLSPRADGGEQPAHSRRHSGVVQSVCFRIASIAEGKHYPTARTGSSRTRPALSTGWPTPATLLKIRRSGSVGGALAQMHDPVGFASLLDWRGWRA
jgi:hypothetical protein